MNEVTSKLILARANFSGVDRCPVIRRYLARKRLTRSLTLKFTLRHYRPGS
jgi:hypothetical protein